MNRPFIILFVIAIITASCSSSNSATELEVTPTDTATKIPPTSTATEIPQTPTFTPTPTLSLPVSQLTAVPSSNTKITTENVKDLQEIAHYYGAVNYVAKITKDNKYLFIRDSEGIDKYDYETKSLLSHVAVSKLRWIPFENGDFPATDDLQISDDGKWAAFDSRWLLDLRDEDKPILRDLIAEIDLKYYPAFYLSPDGTILIVSERKCNNTCLERFQIISLMDNSQLYVWAGGAQTLHGFGVTFSPNGSYLAVPNPIWDGSGGVSGNVVNIWNTSDFSRVSSINITYPFFVGENNGIAFTEDSSLIAIGQKNKIELFDVVTGEPVKSINVCDSYQRRIIVIPVKTLNIVDMNDCKSGIWTIRSDQPAFSEIYLDLSKISFDTDGNPFTIPYQHSTGNWYGYLAQRWFKFLDDDHFAFNSQVNYYVDQTCNFQVSKGSANCSNDKLILGTDGKYYKYNVEVDTVDIFDPGEESTTPFFTIFYSGTAFELYALDPIDDLIIYRAAQSGFYNKIIVMEMRSNKVIKNWEGQYLIDKVVFSSDNKYLALCLKQEITNKPYNDKLVLLDTAQKKIVSQTTITCSNSALAFSPDGTKLAAESYNKIIVLDLLSSYKVTSFDIEASNYAIGFSPDNKILLASCFVDSICFLDVIDGKEIHRINNMYGVSGIAFSKDETLMALSTNWGLISVWAIPPFSINNYTDTESNDSLAFPMSFEYPLDDQTIGIDGHYLFKIVPVEGAQQYSWSFYQNGETIIENQITSDENFAILNSDPLHAKFVAGDVVITVRAKVNGQWTSPATITITLQ